MLITIGGLYGSGGQEMAEALAEEFGYPIYGKELMEKAVELSGIDMHRRVLDFYDETDESLDRYVQPFKSALLNLELDVLPIGRSEQAAEREEPCGTPSLAKFMEILPVNRRTPPPFISKKAAVDRIKFAHAKAVLDAAEAGNAIFVGRCAGYILAGREDVVRIFTTASDRSCRERIAALYNLDIRPELDSFLEKTNLRRAHFYETFTDSQWDAVSNYDYCINTDCLGLDKSIQLVKSLIAQKTK